MNLPEGRFPRSAGTPEPREFEVKIDATKLHYTGYYKILELHQLGWPVEDIARAIGWAPQVVQRTINTF